jgi:hypothetical protein
MKGSTMAQADATALQPVQAVLRSLRELKGVRETRPGVFQLRGAVFAQFVVEDGRLRAELRKPGGAGFDRYALDSPPQQRKFTDDARLRVARLDED